MGDAAEGPLVLPHDPYVRAVVAALGPRARLRSTGWENTNGLVTLLEASVELADDLFLIWSHWSGWWYGWRDGDAVDHEAHLRVGQAIPTPGEIVAALELAAQEDLDLRAVVPVAEHPPPPGVLPGPVREALDRGDINVPEARILAAYWPAA